LDRILHTLHQYFAISDTAEITLEANPDDLEKEVIHGLQKAGINRLSIGVQSFFDEDLSWMGRVHTADQAETCIKDVQHAGIHNLSIDLIYGSPTTTDQMWEDNLLKTAELGIPHISSYCLTVEERTALAHQVKTGKKATPSVDQASNQFEILMDLLGSKQYEHYEISNFAREGFIAVHNTNYWKGVAYMGFGPSAHSYYNDKRSWNIAHNMQYIERIQQGKIPEESETITSDMKYNEYVMTGLRTKWGVQKSHIAHIGENFLRYFEKNIQKPLGDQMVRETEGSIVLTRAGKYYADRIAMELFIDS
jgi:oxygen-independent coproporphyrinogen-3 oxidase